MTITIDAVYENGLLKLAEPLPFSEHEKVRVTVRAVVDPRAARDAVERTYGLFKWGGDLETADRIALDADLGIEEAR